MKVLLIAHNASIQGSGIAFASISKQLAALGIDVVTIVPRKYGVYNLIGETHNVKKYVIRQIFNEVYPSTNGWLNKMLYIPELLRRIIAKYIFKMKLRKIIEYERPTIIHSNTGTIRVGAELAKEFGIPHFWHIRECQSLGCGFIPFGGEEKVKRLFQDRNNHCIAITRSVFNYYELNPYKDKVIYDGVFSENTALSAKRETKRNIILYIGLLSEKKGIRLLLSAIDKIYNHLKDYSFCFAGEDQIGFFECIKHYKWKNQVEYLGFVEDVYSLMAQSKMVVITTEFEGFGFVTAEAMLNRTLVIGRNTAGTKEQMDNANKIIGYDVALRFTSENELAKRILEAINMSNERYFEITEKAYDVVKSMYTTEKNVFEIINYYKTIIK